jgi:hypothetical protein
MDARFAHRSYYVTVRLEFKPSPAPLMLGQE